VRRRRETGSVAPSKIGGYRSKKLSGPWRAWLIGRCREKDFTLRGLVGELAERGLQVLPLGVGVRPRRRAELQKNADRQ
jgi:putative transposase